MADEGTQQALGPPLAGRTELVERSPIREMYDLARAYDGDLVHLEIGEPDFGTPAHVVEAAAEAAASGATRYTANAGILDLRRAIADDLDGRAYDPEREIVVTAGAMEALALVALTAVEEGGRVVVPTPAWPNYGTHAVMADAELVEVPLDRDTGFALDAERLAAEITDDTALVILTTPSNPTGRIFDADAIARVVHAAAAHDAFVVADEVYKELSYETDHVPVAGATDHDNVITIGSCSKTYAMTGWRVGWIAAPERIVQSVLPFHESVVACAPSISQHAALEALTGDTAPVETMHSAFRERREYVLDRVAEIPDVTCPRPDGAFYCFLDCGGVGADSVAMARRLLEEYGVVTAPGSGFGSHVDDHIRVSFATDRSRLEKGFDRIEAFVRSGRQ